MPGLQSFSVCTAISLGSIYLLQITWFVAWMYLDEKRILAGRSGLLPCIAITNHKPSSCSQVNHEKLIITKYAKLLSYKSFKIAVLIVTLIFTSIGISGCFLMEQKFDFLLLLPKDSYLRQWHETKNYLYPDKGWTANIYSDSFDHSHLETFENLTKSLDELQKSRTYIQGYETWWTGLKKYAQEKENFTKWEDFANSQHFPIVLSNFLFSSYGAKFQSDFKFNSSLLCGQAAPFIKSSRSEIQYLPFDGPKEHIPAKRRLDELINISGVPGGFSFVKVYAKWEMDEIISEEMQRNVLLAMTCIFLVTFILLANIRVSLMVLLTVTVTFVDIIGFLHFWNITIDVFSASGAVLSIGLCVDYAVHLGLAFIIGKGSRHEKSVFALTSIGSAIFNGGLSTFLALVLLGFSTSHIFLSFFKVFVLTVVFGLFHGLVLLPVMLAVAGPMEVEENSNIRGVEENQPQ